MTVERLVTGSPECDAFVQSHSSGLLYHLSGIQRVICTTFRHESIYLCARAGRQITGVLPLIHMRSRLFGNFLISVPFFNYGGVCAADEPTREHLLEAAISEAQRCGAAHIELRHTDVQYPALQSKSHKVAMILELPKTEDELWASFKSKLRSQIRRPGKDGVTAKIGKLNLLDDFYHVFATNMRDLGTPVYARALFENMLREFPNSTWIITAYLGDEPIAAGFLAGYKEMIEIPWASSVREHNRLSANMLVYWEALKLAVEQGYTRFDFGRSTPNEGTYKFKAQWGSRPVALHWEYWLPNGKPLPDISPTNSKYQAAIRLWQKLPIPVTRLIGPPIVRNIP